MPKIAVVGFYHSSGEDSYYSDELIAVSITDWAEVSEEDISVLYRYINKLDAKSHYSWRILRQSSGSEIPKTIARCFELAEKERVAEEKRKAEYKAKKEAAEKRKREKAREKLLKNKEEERKLYEELRNKFEGKTSN